MTTEAAVTKMAYLFGRGVKPERLRVAMSEDLRGERRVIGPAGWGQLSSLTDEVDKLRSKRIPQSARRRNFY